MDEITLAPERLNALLERFYTNGYQAAVGELRERVAELESQVRAHADYERLADSRAREATLAERLAWYQAALQGEPCLHLVESGQALPSAARRTFR